MKSRKKKMKKLRMPTYDLDEMSEYKFRSQKNNIEGRDELVFLNTESSS